MTDTLNFSSPRLTNRMGTFPLRIWMVIIVIIPFLNRSSFLLFALPHASLFASSDAVASSWSDRYSPTSSSTDQFLKITAKTARIST
ncbi:hypothetical protein KC345_g291 [Hortaea werneckii]|nr:hypothetical protein KC345_g291 [Hortaea werneckii]